MSHNLRIILIVGVLALAGGAAWYYNLIPISALQREPAPVEGESFQVMDPNCPPGASAGTAPTGDPTATTPAPGDPATGAGTDPGAAPDPGATGTDPSAPVDPATAPAAGAPVAQGAGARPGEVVAAAGSAYDPGSASDSRLHAAAADATAPAGTDPSGGGAVDPAASPDTPTGSAVDPSAPGTAPDVVAPGDDAAAGGSTPQATDPCAAEGTVDGTAPAPGADTGMPGGPDGAGGGADGGAGAGADGGAPGGAGGQVAPRTSSDGSNEGNNSEALLTSQAVVEIGRKSNLAFTVATTLVPAAGGLDPSKQRQLRTYRSNVTAAVLRIRISDEASQAEWDKGSRRVRTRFVNSFLAFLRKRYPNAARSVTVVDTSGNVLAVGDAPAGSSGRVSILPRS